VAASFDLPQLAADLRTQLGFPADLPIYVRLERIRVWGPLRGFDSSAALTPVNVAFRDFIAENSTQAGTLTVQNRVLEQYTRYPDQVNRACIGYEYPIAHQNLSLFAATGVLVTLFSATGLGPGSVVYTNLKWRTGVLQPAALPTDNAGAQVERSSWWS